MATTVTQTARRDGWITVAFDASAAESADLLAACSADTYFEIKDFVVTLSVAGTFSLLANTAALTGAMPLAAGVPLMLPSVHGVEATKLNYTAATGLAKGSFLYKIKPT